MHADESDTRIVEEMGLLRGAVRIDVAAINGSLHGYEIKSERDTLARLEAQCAVYNLAFDFATIVLSPVHLDKATAAVPSWWGIWVARSTPSGIILRRHRKERRNPKIDPLTLAQLLWKDELVEVLEQQNLATGFAGKPRNAICARLVRNIDVEQIATLVRQKLKTRVNWLAAAEPQ